MEPLNSNLRNSDEPFAMIQILCYGNEARPECLSNGNV